MSHQINDAARNVAHRVAGEISNRSSSEADLDSVLLGITTDLLPRFGENWNVHSIVTSKRMTLSRIVYYYELYKKIVDIPGLICEFGVHWGATMAMLINFRGMLEPYNVSRNIVGFDTFTGFANVHDKDGQLAKNGDYESFSGYEEYLSNILEIHEQCSPVGHIRKFELVKGDASTSVIDWLAKNPEAVVSMAIFDMDIYKPTRDALNAILPRLIKGSLLVFDEFNCPHFPGETAAVSEILGLNKIALRRTSQQAYCAWAVFGD
jgi:hypothetical protein